MNALSLLPLSAQLRSIRELDTALACRFVGAAGADVMWAPAITASQVLDARLIVLLLPGIVISLRMIGSTIRQAGLASNFRILAVGRTVICHLSGRQSVAGQPPW